MTKRIDWPLKGLRVDLNDGWYWLVYKGHTDPHPARFTSSSHVPGGGTWRLDYGKEEYYATFVFENYHFLGPVEMITYER